MKKTGLIIILLLILRVGIGFGQDPHFSQFYAAPLYLAPSFAGAAENTRIMTNYRDQWPKMPGVFVTYSFSADHYIPDLNSGFGLFVMKDQAGDGKINITNISANYAYKVNLNDRWYFRPGIKGFYYQNFINYNKIVFNDQLGFDSNNPSSVEIEEDNRTNYFDFGASVLFHNEKYWAGGSIDHMIKMSPSFRDNLNYAPMKYTLFGGANFPVGNSNFNRNRNKIITAFQLKSQGQSQQLDFGAYYKRNSLMVGLWYRGLPLISQSPTSDALIVMLGYTNATFTVGYSYDLTVSRLITYTGGAHELSFIYKFNVENVFGEQRHSAIPCPAF